VFVRLFRSSYVVKAANLKVLNSFLNKLSRLRT
jgi:hypothetical protein